LFIASQLIELDTDQNSAQRGKNIKNVDMIA